MDTCIWKLLGMSYWDETLEQTKNLLEEIYCITSLLWEHLRFSWEELDGVTWKEDVWVSQLDVIHLW